MEFFLNGALALWSSPTSVAIFFAGLLGGLLFGAVPGVSMLPWGPSSYPSPDCCWRVTPLCSTPSSIAPAPLYRTKNQNSGYS